jgi:pyruvate,water dikinase
MQDPNIVWFEDGRSTDISEVGGKFASLARLREAGARVPAAYAVATFAYRKFIVQLGSQVASILEKAAPDDIMAVEEASREIATLVSSSPMPPEVAESVGRAYIELARRENAGENLPVAVRSSATAEDMLNASVAGQHETFLWVRGREAVIESVKKCWASIFSSRSLSYRKARGISQVGVEMGVAVQRMVEAKKSGVMFTLNPSNGDPSKISIDASWGLGEAVVSGVVTPDLFVVDKVTMEVLTRKTGTKQKEFVVSGDSVVERDTTAEKREVLCLADTEVIELANAGKAVERAFGKPQDIEWAIDQGATGSSIHILQARPETVWSSKSGRRITPMGALDRVVDTLRRGQKVK